MTEAIAQRQNRDAQMMLTLREVCREHPPMELARGLLRWQFVRYLSGAAIENIRADASRQGLTMEAAVDARIDLSRFGS